MWDQYVLKDKHNTNIIEGKKAIGKHKDVKIPKNISKQFKLGLAWNYLHGYFNQLKY